MIKPTLTGLSWFCFISGLWLAVMETLLRHSGFEERIAIGLLIAIQSLASTLLPGRRLLLPGAFAIAIIGACALISILSGNHFEGYALLIGAACVLQGTLTVATAVWPHHLPADQTRRT